ncbi:PA14 domain-containing protein [Flavobacterium sp. J27]|uniref:PA14 domain-containing protein n=1 Tax=Flavobacterium sp. J27 TaxID=2060419 RepID=UPI0013EE75A4|nr:PA14 domain-containing protein [Flavobacterium sp. J27]
MKKKTQKFKSFVSSQNAFALATSVLHVVIILFCIKSNGQTLLFNSGFEGTTSINQLNAQKDIFSGIDTTVGMPNNWNTITSQPNIGLFRLEYEEGNANQRRAAIVNDPVNANNKVLNFKILQPHINMLPGYTVNNIVFNKKGRIQVDMYGCSGLKEVFQSVRLFIPNDFNKIINESNFPGVGDWITLFEFWNDAPWTSTNSPFRFGVGLQKEIATKGAPLYFKASGQRLVNGNWVQPEDWENMNTHFEVPIGKWMTIEYYIKEGKVGTGRFYFAVTPDGEEKTILWDLKNVPTCHPNDPTPSGLSELNILKLYTSNNMINQMNNLGGVFQVYWDDLKFWKNLTPEQVNIASPSAFTAANILSNQVTFNWNDNATNESEYFLERRNLPDGQYEVAKQLGINKTDCVDNNVIGGESYRYRLSGKNAYGRSKYVYLDVTTPSIVVAPSNLNVTAIQENQATLKWVDNSNNETAFVIDRRSVTDGGDYTYLSTVNANATSFTDATLMPNKEYRYRLSAKNGNVISDFSYSAVFKTIELNGTGLQATYYNNMDFTGTSITRIDPTINFNWGNGSPSTSIQADTFSASWIGQVKPKTTGTYTFYTNSDDGVRLWVNGVLLINKWNNQATTEYSGTVQLNGGQKYNIALEYFDNTRGAVVQLSWSSIGLPKEIIPQTALYPSSGAANKVVNTVNSTTIVKEISESNPSFLVYPNPAKDILYFNLETINESSIVAELVSSENKVVKTVSYAASKDKPTYSFDTTEIPAGIYYLKINNGLQIIIKKIIID